MPLLIGLDLGTTTLKAVLYDSSAGQVVYTAARPTPVAHPQPGWSQHDPEALWQAAADCLRELAQAAGAGRAIAGLAISSMAEAGVLLDERGQALAPMIAWYDRRSEPQAAWVEQQVDAVELYRRTGQRASPSFGVTKLLWTKAHLPHAYAQGTAWLPAPAYLLWKLTGRQAVDYSIASRTLLFDQTTLDWSDDLLERFHLPRRLFPPVLPGGTPLGEISGPAAQATGLPPGLLCSLGGHDHLCASLAAGAHATGAVVDSTGSANALLLLLPSFLPDPSRAPAFAASGYACYAYVLPGRYVLKGGLKAAGSAIDWLARQFSGRPDGAPDYALLEREAAEGAGLRRGPLWLPHLIGSGTPEGDRFSRAALVGVQFEHNRGDLFRALLESLALWTRHNLEAMQAQTGIAIETISLTGGVTRLALLSQLKADALNRPVVVPQVPEAAGTGAALLAGLGAGVFSDPSQALGSLTYGSQVVQPNPQRARWYEDLYQTVYRPLYPALKDIHQSLSPALDSL